MSRLEMGRDNQRGFTLLNVLLALTVVILLGSTTFVTIRQVFTDRELAVNRLALTRQTLQEVGGNFTATIAPYQALDMSTKWLRYGLVASGGDITLSGSPQIKSESLPGQGHIYAAGDIHLTGSPVVDGDATAAGRIIKSGSAVITGVGREYFAWPLEFLTDQEITNLTQRYLVEAQAGGTFNGNKSFSGGTFDLGPLYITGDLKVNSAKVRINGTVYVGGEVDMTGSASIEGAGSLVSTGSITMTGSGRLALADIPLMISVNGDVTSTGSNEIAAVVYAPRGKVKFTGTANFYGAALGNQIDIAGPTALVFTYPFTPR